MSYFSQSQISGGRESVFGAAAAAQSVLTPFPLKTSARMDKRTIPVIQSVLEQSRHLKPFISAKPKPLITEKNFVFHDFDVEFNHAYLKSSKRVVPFGSKEEKDLLNNRGFYNRPADKIHLRPTSTAGLALRLAIHRLSSPRFRDFFGKGIDDGLSLYFANLVLAERGLAPLPAEHYGDQLRCAKNLIALAGITLVGGAYFHNHSDLVQHLTKNLRIGPVRTVDLMKDGLCTARFAHQGSQRQPPAFKTRTADERIREDDFEKVLAVLAGPSPWQEFIRRNLQIVRKHLPPRPFRVVSLKDFTATMTALGAEDDSHTAGVTDKFTGIITMKEFFGGSSAATFLGAALHEAVHLVSHPPRPGVSQKSTARGFLGVGLLEGLVESVTIDILTAQDIKLAKDERRGHMKRVPVVKELILRHGVPLVPLLGRLLFGGDVRPFAEEMHRTFSVDGWNKIGELTTADNFEQAIQLMNELRARQQRRRP